MQIFMVCGVPYAELESAKNAALESYFTTHETQWHTRDWSGGKLHELWVHTPLDQCTDEIKGDVRRLTDRLWTLQTDYIWMQPAEAGSVFETTLR